ncbi:hypothetical protein Pmani_010583 [Petrolisthes manimaculis]|uniref:Nucleoporin Nup54 alpha-helical domain-containing protein n=1 Tax=Petrolisthes manimaculis TaxID=1843537 RepID=A0AAE1Q2U1_9EUCA|nr:hypothetical protein Pmani_010583 [Petrolisthes manimaculis]
MFPGFNFGGASTPTTGTGTSGFSFGGGSTTGTTQSTGFSFGGASTTGTTQSTGFTFGGPSTSVPVATSASTAFGSTFGTPASASTATGWNTNQTKPTFGFGTTTAGTSGGFLLGSGFGTKPSTGFGTQTSDLSQQQQQQQQLGQPDPSLALHLAICTPSYFNNENDEVLRKWNQLQAFWGAGKGYYAPNMPPVEFTPENPYCRFKVVCYAKIPTYHNEEGLLQVVIGKAQAEVEPHKQQIVSTLMPMFAGAEVVVEEIFSADTLQKTNIRMYVQQTLPNGEKQRATATDVARHMLGPTNAQTLKNLCIQEVIPLLTLTEAQMKDYLDTPQRGIDPALWEQGKRENPDPKKYFPVVKVGFQELQKQFKYQEEHAEKLQTSMKDIMEEITQLRHKQTMVKAAIQNAKWKQANLTRRILKLVSAQEVERKRGVPLDQTEEQIRMRLEDLYMQLMQPTQYRGCLNELMAQMSVKPGNSRGTPRYGLVTDKEKEVSRYVAWQQDALKAVVGVLKEDMQIVDSMLEEVQQKS